MLTGTNTGVIFQNTSGAGIKQFTDSTAANADFFINYYGGSGSANGTSLIIQQNSTERARIDSDGRLLVGTSTAVNDFDGNVITPQIQLEGTSLNTSSLSTVRNSADSGGPNFCFGKSRSASVNGRTIVQSGDNLGEISFDGANGTDFIRAASIKAELDGTPGAVDMPGRLVFATTPDNGSSPTERMRITSTGQVRLAGAGITFNGDTAADNELDDYEEGTWTPAQGSGLTVVGAFSSIGRYTKIGNLVTVYGQLTGATSIEVSAVGQMTDNLPFAHSGEMGSTGIATGISSAAAAASFISIGGVLSVLSLQAISGVTALSFTNTYRV